MLKFFYRLKRRRGAVLFAVIAMMTLLIVMASTAYFTARSSYQTVINNYNFEQMYLSATSVSDMLIEAVTQSTSHGSTSAAVGKNYFDSIKKQVQDLKKLTAYQDNHTSYGHFEAVSSNIYGVTGDQAIFIAGANDPIEAGVLDAVKVVVTFDRCTDTASPANNVSTPIPSSYNGTVRFYFTFTTTAYYRGNTITIQDTIYNEAVIGGTTSPNSAPDFNNFFTSTGQKLKADGTKDKSDDRVVVIDLDSITDKTYFQSKVTCFTCDSRSNIFLGGVTSSGSLFLTGQAKTGYLRPDGVAQAGALPAPTSTDRHDWFIGGDLGLLHTNNEINLNGNNLYVKGDLIVSAQNGIKAGNIFVEGNVYVVNGKFPITLQGDPTITDDSNPMKAGGLFVGGNVKAGDPWTLNMSGKGNLRDSSWTTVSAEIAAVKTLIEEMSEKANVGIIGSERKEFSYNGWGATDAGSQLNNGWDFSGALYQGGSGTVSGWTNPDPSGKANPGTYDPASITANVARLDPDTDIAHPNAESGTYNHTVVTMKVSDIFTTGSASAPTGSPMQTSEYENYTAKDETYANTLNIDFSGLSITPNNLSSWPTTDGHYDDITFTNGSGDSVTGKVLDANNAEFTFTSAGGQEAKVNCHYNGNMDKVTTTIPWCSAGYNLYLQCSGSGFPFTDDYERNIEFETKPSTYKVEQQKDKDGNPLYYSVNPVTNQVVYSTTNGAGFSPYKAKVVDEDNTLAVVLRGNFTEKNADGTVTKATDTKGYNAFSWVCNQGGEGKNNTVIAVPGSTGMGSVVFEMGNINQTGKYSPYRFLPKAGEAADVKTKSVVTYYTRTRELVATKAQKDKLYLTSTQPWEGSSAINTLFQSGSDPAPAFDNYITLVSNEHQATAVNSFRKGSLFCGYIYAPNATYVDYGDGKYKVFGGIIVSDYGLEHATYVYAEPNPNIINSIFGKLATPNGGGGTPPVVTPDKWFTESTRMGRNYLG